jgi:hypothetical protein
MKITFHNVPGTIDVYMDVLRAICGETEGKSLIDLGCCFAPNTPKLGFSRRTYIDVIDRKLDHPEEQQFFVKADAVEYTKSVSLMIGVKFDVAICSDFLEHLHPDQASKFLWNMCEISRKQIIFVPMGEIFPLHNTSTEDPEAHHSIWQPDDFSESAEHIHGEWAKIVLPDCHKEWGHGAFFAFRGSSLGLKNKNEFERVVGELSEKQWFVDAYKNGDVHIEGS